VESDDMEHGEGSSEVRLFRSDVHIELPDDSGVIAAIAEMRPEVRSTVATDKSDEASAFASGMSDVAANEEVHDEPAAPGMIVTPVSYLVDPEKIGKKKGLSRGLGKLASERPIPGSAEETIIMKSKYDNKQRMIWEIAANQLLQDELAKSDPNFVCVSAFLNMVCGTDKGALKLKETAESVIQGGLLSKDKMLAPIIMSSSDTLGTIGNVYIQ